MKKIIISFLLIISLFAEEENIFDQLNIGGFISSSYKIGIGKYGDKSKFFEPGVFALILDFKITDNLYLNSEIINQLWWDVSYNFKDYFNLKFGKLLIPFGEEHSYEKITGKIVPVLWAEPGILSYGSVYPYQNLQLNYTIGITKGIKGEEKLDLQKIDSITGASPLKTDSDNPSLCGRIEIIPILGLNITSSGYICKWLNNNKIYLGNLGLIYNTRIGILGDFIFKGEYSLSKIEYFAKNYKQTGYYYQLTNKPLEKIGLSFIYGEYDPDNLEKNIYDLHNTIVRVEYFPREELTLRLEYQWNMEAINEIKNDWLKASILVEF